MQRDPLKSDEDVPIDKLKWDGGVSSRTGEEKPSVVLVGCGSFNPPTNMHLRMFELAKDALNEKGFDVLGGYLSPVNDAYKKQGLESADHRIAMCKLAVECSETTMVDKWEACQTSYQRSRVVLKRIKDGLERVRKCDNGALPNLKVMLLGGSDLLHSFSIPGVWRPEDVDHILANHGVVCIARTGSDPTSLLSDENSCLYKHKDNVVVAVDPFDNAISSSVVRKEVKKGHSIKYVVPNSVRQYILEHGLYK